MAWNGGCGCGNWWNGPARNVCGTFEEPEVEDQGQCSPRHVRITCEAPVLPEAQCDDEEYETIYQPENVDNPFAISARLFNECCEEITDENGEAITLILTQTSGADSGTCAT
jgi:hypothetical protein